MVSGLRSVVGFVGSRSLPSVGCAGGLVEQVVAAARFGGRTVAVGCCVGADAAVLRAVLASQSSCSSGDEAQLQVFAAFGADGAGACSLSAVDAVGEAAAVAFSPGHGCVARSWVRWLAGGGPSVPVARRLAARTRALVAFVGSRLDSCLVAFLAPGSGRGTLFAVRLAVVAGLPVAVFPVGGASLPASLPRFGPVAWRRLASSGLWSRAFSPVSPRGFFRPFPLVPVPPVSEVSPPASSTIQQLSPGLAVDTSTGEIIPSNHPVIGREARMQAGQEYVNLWLEGRTFTPPNSVRQETEMPHPEFWSDIENHGRAVLTDKKGRSRRFKVSHRRK